MWPQKVLVYLGIILWYIYLTSGQVPLYRNTVPTWVEYSRQRGRVFAYCVSILSLGVVASLPTTVRSYVDPCLVARVARFRLSQLCHFWSQVLAVLTVAGHGYHINSIDPIFQL